jgi:hypothetical protein
VSCLGDHWRLIHLVHACYHRLLQGRLFILSTIGLRSHPPSYPCATSFSCLSPNPCSIYLSKLHLLPHLIFPQDLLHLTSLFAMFSSLIIYLSYISQYISVNINKTTQSLSQSLTLSSYSKLRGITKFEVFFPLINVTVKLLDIFNDNI